MQQFNGLTGVQFSQVEETGRLLAPEAVVASAGLRYVSSDDAGIHRKKHGTGFSYTDSAGRVIHDKRVLWRIRCLAIPPAWTDVWICPNANGHIQATGFDARGRKQYRYNAEFRALRESAKFEHILLFAAALPKIRDRRVATIVRALQELPGQQLFQYLDADGANQRVTSSDVNDYLREISG
ncbi:MAG TPA: hypothetical protein VHL34_09455, partial [Rhizomicrobium sp.]|nr:hypothetical protein [Rhizomicrobium sp.]